MAMPSDDARKWDLKTDLLVFGAGAAGMTAALVSEREGLQTVLCEKSDKVGGTTATSAAIRSSSSFPRRSRMRIWRACAAKACPIFSLENPDSIRR